MTVGSFSVRALGMNRIEIGHFHLPTSFLLPIGRDNGLFYFGDGVICGLSDSFSSV
jgi:hypothetical protein